MLADRKNYNGISATSPNQARIIKSFGKNGTFEKARIEVSAFLLGIAPRHHASDNAPDSWEKLKGYFEDDMMYLDCPDIDTLLFKFVNMSIPVFNGGGQTVYTSKAANLAYRAWHDYTHLKLNASFELDDEKQVSKNHLAEAKKRGLSRGARYLLWIDSQGQNDYFKIHGEFVNNQYVFCKACFENGLKLTLKRGVKF